MNPEAIARGTVFVQARILQQGCRSFEDQSRRRSRQLTLLLRAQCETPSCAAWHKIADNLNLWGEEFQLKDMTSDAPAGGPAEEAQRQDVSPDADGTRTSS